MTQKTKILIVEDEVIAAITTQKILEKWGYEVCGSVISGEDAVKSVKEEDPDIVLMDIRLVGPIDGIEATRQIRVFSQTRIIFMTGYSDKEIRASAEALDPTAYLLKPVDMYKLKPLIAGIVSDLKGI